jgi:hypothetical protein
VAYQKQYRTIVPVEHGNDHDTARWLARESFEKRATSDGLQIIDYTERAVPVDEIPPKVLKQLGRPLTDFDWFEFTGVGKLDKELFDWLSAECAWNNDQIREWLAAEYRAKVTRA